jgi:hypothetical protein
MRVLFVAALVTLVGVLTGFGVHEWRSAEKPRQITPIDLRPAPEREPRKRGSQGRAEERPTNPSTSGTPPTAPSPAVGGQPSGDSGEDDGGNDG